MQYIDFVKDGDIYIIYNRIYNQNVGEIRRERFGTWMHWQLFLYEGCGCTNGCLKEISKFITSLYSRRD